MTSNDAKVVNTVVAEEELQIISEAVQYLPPLNVVKELLSIGVCVRCILRLFRVSGCVYSCSFLSPAMLCLQIAKSDASRDLLVEDYFKANVDSTNQHFLHESDVERVLCIVCLGILQFSFSEEKERLVKRDHVSDFTTSIAEAIKHEGHEISSFVLEISIPLVISENERAMWFYMKSRYGSQLWFEENCSSEPISLKDALKLSITSSLETMLGVQSGVGSFHIRLTYTHTKAPLEVPSSIEGGRDCKRIKTGTKITSHTVRGNEGGLNSCDGSLFNVMKHRGPADGKLIAFAHGSGNGSHNHASYERFISPPEKVKEPCCLVFHCSRSPIYIGGRYLKYSRNVSQTRWIIDDERRGEAAVEEIIGSEILPVCRGDNYKFHAAGREDIDVRMLGSGRPFLIEVQNARHIPSKASITEMEEKINNSEAKNVIVRNLKVVGTQGWALMREGEAEKQKQYAALVWISRPLQDEDLQTFSNVKDMKLMQRTPIRVLHRRSPLDREKIIHWMEVERISGSEQYFLLHLCTQAGTYIKEFVHGDLGRTHPSIGSILGCRAEILQLDVTDVKMDCFN